jgi:hypothetical protein
MELKYNEKDQQGNAAFNEHNAHTTQQQEPVARSPDGPQTNKAGHKAEHGQTNH